MSAASNTLRLILIGEDRSASKAAKGVGDEVEKSGKKMQTFHKVGTAAGVALAGGLVLAGKAAFAMTKKAAEDQQAASRLATTLHSAAGATDAQVASTENWITAQGKAYGVADDDLRPALSKLAVATGSVSKAQKLASLAMDVSAGSGKSLESVSFALAKAQNGNVSGLARLGVQTTKTTGDTMALEKAQTAVKSAQLAYTAAVKAHGKGSAEASIAADKLKQAEENVGAAREKTKKTTLSLDEITKNLAATYGGAAAKNADTVAGKQKIMAVQMQELQEQIGSGLLPVMSKLVSIGLQVVNWISNNTRTAGILVGALGTLLATVYALSVASKIYTVVLAAQTEGTFANAVATRVAAGAARVWSAAQWALNAAMDANPIGLVVIAIAALVVGFIIAYKHSATFRAIVQGALHAVGDAGTWMWSHALKPAFDGIVGGLRVVGRWATWLWNNAFAPALRFIVGGLAVLINIWGHMLSALGHIPGFGWAKDAGKALEDAAAKAQHLADNIGKIPTHKDSTVVLNVVHNVVHTTGGHVPAFANGTSFAPGGLSLVGERGPELINLPRGSQVYPHGKGPNGGDIHIHVTGLVPADEDAVIRKIHSGLLKVKAQGFAGKPLGLA